MEWYSKHRKRKNERASWVDGNYESCHTAGRVKLVLTLPVTEVNELPKFSSGRKLLVSSAIINTMQQAWQLNTDLIVQGFLK